MIVLPSVEGNQTTLPEMHHLLVVVIVFQLVVTIALLVVVILMKLPGHVVL